VYLTMVEVRQQIRKPPLCQVLGLPLMSLVTCHLPFHKYFIPLLGEGNLETFCSSILF
jgi:hypothetical protein